MKLTRHPQDAADHTQEVFVRAFRARERQRTDMAPEGWLFKIAYRCFLDSIRNHRRRVQTVSAEALSNENYQLDFMDTAPNPEQILLDHELSEPMKNALEALTEEQRELIRLSHLGELSLKELAEIFGCGTTTMKTRVHRANLSLKNHLSSYGFDHSKLSGAGVA